MFKTLGLPLQIPGASFGKNNNDFYALIVKTGDDNNGIFSGMSLEAFKNMVQIGVPANKWMLGLIASNVVKTTGL